MKPVFLIGYMGAGKTTLGRLLAGTLHLSFIDLDLFLERRFHKTVRELFAERGEDGFRELERRMLLEVGEFNDVVIATGGGTPCFFDNMSYMKERGVCVYLKTSVSVLFSRLRKAAAARPLLQGKDDDELKRFIVENLERRSSFYEQASLVFNADRLEDSSQIRESLDRLKDIVETHLEFDRK